MITFLTILLLNTLNAAASGGWQQRRAISITNSNASELRDYQTHIMLDASATADLRFTDDGGTKQLSYWVESYDSATQRVTVWVKVPQLPPSSTKTIYAYSSNPQAEDLSSSRRTFEMADDFGQPGLGYFTFGPPTTILTKTEAWETQSPHTLSVVELNRDGYKYWGYYGLADCGGIGIVRSNDLLHWQKMATPLLNKDGERWPSAITVNGTIYMIYDRDHCGTSHLVLRTSTDGTTFSAPYRVIVRQEQGVRNQNPALFHDPASGKFFLYWFRGGAESGFWQIKVRSADTVEGLANESGENVLLDVPYELAAPNMLAVGGVYYLSTEVNENAWKTKIYSSGSPSGPFVPLPDAPQLSDNQACLFQHVITASTKKMHGFICKIIGSDWVLQTRTADISAGRTSSRVIDPGVWEKLSGEWSTVQQNGNVSAVGVASADKPALLKTALTGADYVFGARGRSAGTAWGVAVRLQDERNYTRVLVQPNGTLGIERLIDGKVTSLANVPLRNFDSVPWHMLEARVFGNATEAWLDGVLVATGVSDQPPLPNGHSALIVVSDNAQFDDVRWRKFAAQEPTIQIGKAETKTAQSAHWLSDTRPAPAYAPTSQPVAPASDSPVLVVLAALFTVISVGIVGVGFARSRG